MKFGLTSLSSLFWKQACWLYQVRRQTQVSLAKGSLNWTNLCTPPCIQFPFSGVVGRVHFANVNYVGWCYGNGYPWKRCVGAEPSTSDVGYVRRSLEWECNGAIHCLVQISKRWMPAYTCITAIPEWILLISTAMQQSLVNGQWSSSASSAVMQWPREKESSAPGVSQPRIPRSPSHYRSRWARAPACQTAVAHSLDLPFWESESWSAG